MVIIDGYHNELYTVTEFPSYDPIDHEVTSGN